MKGSLAALILLNSMTFISPNAMSQEVNPAQQDAIIDAAILHSGSVSEVLDVEAETTEQFGSHSPTISPSSNKPTLGYDTDFLENAADSIQLIPSQASEPTDELTLFQIEF